MDACLERASRVFAAEEFSNGIWGFFRTPSHEEL